MNMIKSRFQYYHLSNDILIGTLIANILGDRITSLFFFNRSAGMSQDFITFVGLVDLSYSIIACLIAVIVIVTYESPIRKCLKRFYHGRQPDAALLPARRIG